MAKTTDDIPRGSDVADTPQDDGGPDEYSRQAFPSVSRFASVVVHDFNNALLTISGYASILASDLAGTPAAEDVHEVLIAAERAAFLARLLPPARRYPGERDEAVEVQLIVSRLLPVLKRAAGTSFDIEADLDPHLPLVVGDESAIEQMLIRFVLDAWSAGRSGRVRVAATLEADDVPLEHATAQPGHVRLTLSACGLTAAGPSTQSVTFGRANTDLR